MIRAVLQLWWYQLYYKLTIWIKVNTLYSRSSSTSSVRTYESTCLSIFILELWTNCTLDQDKSSY